MDINKLHSHLAEVNYKIFEVKDFLENTGSLTDEEMQYVSGVLEFAKSMCHNSVELVNKKLGEDVADVLVDYYYECIWLLVGLEHKLKNRKKC